MLANPGKKVRSRQAALQLPDLGRHVHGRTDARLLALGRLCAPASALPRIAGGRLEVADATVDSLEGELHHLAHALAAAHRSAGLPAVTPAGGDAARRAVIGVAAAAPLWQFALQAIAELDATFVATGTDDLAAWDAAVAAPIARWSVDREAAADEPSLRERMRDAIAEHEAALTAQLDGPAGDDEGRRALAGLWDRALGLATHATTRAATEVVGAVEAGTGAPDPLALVRALGALSALRDAITTRRRELVALGAALDDRAGTGPETAIALALAARAVIAHALAGGVADWLADLAPVPTDHPTLERVRREAERVAAIEDGLARHLAATHAAVRGLIGMDL